MHLWQKVRGFQHEHINCESRPLGPAHELLFENTFFVTHADKCVPETDSRGGFQYGNSGLYASVKMGKMSSQVIN